MSMDKAKLVAPWVHYYRKIEAMFKDDPEVIVEYDNENVKVKLYVDNLGKADALARILPQKKMFGNVTLTIDIIPTNTVGKSKLIDLFEKAFDGNPIVEEFQTVSSPGLSNDVNFIVFENKVVQYYNDDAGDLHGLRSTLYEDIARELFPDVRGIYFCTQPECDSDLFIDIMEKFLSQENEVRF